jgi:mannose-6-phosphate isomerase-like protein (cupin superfamily)
MRIIKINELSWNFNDSENVDIGWDEKFEFKGMDIVHAKIKPKEELKMHYHERKGGDEIFCFFRGGHFLIKTSKEAKEVNTEDPIYVCFEDREPHAIENLSEKELEFQAFYSPPFKPGEVKQ